jgi:hypothetical protein
MKINLGAGRERLPGWTSMDLDTDARPDVIGDVSHLRDFFADGTVDELRAVDVLEHISWQDTVVTLQEWFMVLKPGGTIYIQAPDADAIMADYVFGDPEGRLQVGLPLDLRQAPLIVQTAWRLLGGHYDGDIVRRPGRWHLNAHNALFSESWLRTALERVGFEVDRIERNPHPNLLCWAHRP